MTAKPCTTCDGYLAVRRPALLAPVGRLVTRTGRPPARFLERFMASVHARHVAGKPILDEVPVARPVSPSTLAAKKRVAG